MAQRKTRPRNKPQVSNPLNVQLTPEQQQAQQRGLTMTGQNDTTFGSSVYKDAGGNLFVPRLTGSGGPERYNFSPYQMSGGGGGGVATAPTPTFPTPQQQPTPTAPQAPTSQSPTPNIFGDFLNPSAAPAPQLTSQGFGEDMLSNIYRQSTEGSLQNFNRAANRLRERVDSQAAGAQDQVNNAFLSRGMGTSGLADLARQRAQFGAQDAYAQGLVGLESEFERNRLQGLGIGADAAGQMVQNRQFGDSLVNNLLNAREGRAQQSASDIFGAQQQSALEAMRQQFQGGQNALDRQQQLTLQRDSQRFTGGQNDQNRELQKMLEEMGQNNQNLRDALSWVNRLPPDIVNSPTRLSNPSLTQI